MNHPWMIVVGAALIGWLAVQVFAVFGNARIPMPMNVIIIASMAAEMLFSDDEIAARCK